VTGGGADRIDHIYRVELTGGQPTSGLLRNLNGQAELLMEL